MATNLFSSVACAASLLCPGLGAQQPHSSSSTGEERARPAPTPRQESVPGICPIPIAFTGIANPYTSPTQTVYCAFDVFYRIFKNLGNHPSATNVCSIGGGGHNNTLNVYLPGNWCTSDKPTILYFHGGGFRRGNKQGGDDFPEDGTLDEFFLRLVAKGYPVVTANYRLNCLPDEGPFQPSCPGGTITLDPSYYPSPIQDAFRVITWIRDTSNPDGIQSYVPDTVVAAGESAGAMLAMMLGTLWNNMPDATHLPPNNVPPAGQMSYPVLRPDFVVSVSGLSDFCSWGESGYCADEMVSGVPVCGTPTTPMFTFCDAANGSGGSMLGFEPGFPCLPTNGNPGQQPANLPNGIQGVEWYLGTEWPINGFCVDPGSLLGRTFSNPFLDSSPLHRIDEDDSDMAFYHGKCDRLAPYDQSTRMFADLSLLPDPPVLFDVNNGLEDFTDINPIGHGVIPLFNTTNDLSAASASAAAEFDRVIEAWRNIAGQ